MRHHFLYDIIIITKGNFKKMTVLKEKVIAECKRLLNDKRASLSGDLESIAESMSNESKSSMGDKHETARARMQSEFEQLETYRNDVNTLIQTLERINPLEVAESVFTGTIVETNNGTFFLAIPLGKIVVDGREIFVISPISPMGKVLMGLRAHDNITVNGLSYRVNSFY
jgi:hypothetical protein